MPDTGKLTTFFRLINEESSIRIPKVQRDYAYGRDEDKAREILSGMLDSMLDALRDNRQEIFDFVYGGPYAKDDETQTGMIPLDGQQRLTTLFLLHFYASLFAKDGDGNPIDVSVLKKFSYETRQTANDFRLKLVSEVRDRIIKSGYAYRKTGIKTLIEYDAEFSPAYAFDPTIQSMLVVLEQIELRFADFPDLWDALTQRDNLCFYHITLEKFGLTDELYIKMNSRGKKLTEFEIFKADILDDVRHYVPQKTFDIARKFDTEWMDMIWNEFPDKPAEADIAYMCLLGNILRIAHNWNGSIARSELRCFDGAEVVFMEEFLDFMYQVYLKPGGFAGWWSKFYYEDGSVLGQNDKIRLFRVDRPLFVKAMVEQLSVPEIIVLSATYLAWKINLPYDVAFRRLRIVRNLTRANQRANSAHTPDLPTFIKDIKAIIKDEEIPLTQNSKFIGTSLDEESAKLSLDSTVYDSLLEYENHLVLDASLSLFMDEYLSVDSSGQHLISELKRFCMFFDNGCRSKQNFEKLRVSLLDKEVNYWQAPVNNNQDKVKRRFFFHAAKDYASFFFKNRQRENQVEILRMLKKLESPEKLKDNESKSEEFRIDDWRYYMAKYPASNNPDTTSGCYGWKDYDSCPLDVYILNSTYFEEWNLGWSMMLNILFDRIKNVFMLRWDTHQRPIDVTDFGLFVDFKQEGWIVSSVSDSDISGRILENPLFAAAQFDDDKTSFVLPHDPNAECDYIETMEKCLLSLLDK
ncbi:MAG: DUF262 domain-containing protein [Muribaculaceae bacterium]|nr:DUF262 domain-containing protein [Muribaculaceae bacterium]